MLQTWGKDFRHRCARQWKSSAGFMQGRHFRFGAIYSAFGVILEAIVGMVALMSARNDQINPTSIFVLRNNDIGDVLVTTPLFDALRKRFPDARIVAGVGKWTLPILENNPHLSGVMQVDGPWYNAFTPSRSILAAMRYIYRSDQSNALRAQKFALGIDVLGSHFGSLLLMRAAIPCRVGIRGYAGGHTGRTRHVDNNIKQHVIINILRLADALAPGETPELRPQLFLTSVERARGVRDWESAGGDGRTKVLVAPGGKPDKIWPKEHWRLLISQLAADPQNCLAIVGGQQDIDLSNELAESTKGVNWAGKFSLRETFAATAASDVVICGDSMMVHTAAAFAKPTLVLLGPNCVSSKAHTVGWGYPYPCQMLGGDHQTGKQIASVAEARLTFYTLASSKEKPAVTSEI